jgi:calcineurin-like phosphoesterase family protein
MKFRDDIDPANTWVVSDTHFGHDNIVGFCFRPEDHEQVMVAEWRAHVPDDATVIHLGDLAYRGNARFKNIIAKELTGARKLLILGNHDRQRYSFYKQSGFQIVRPFAIGVSPMGDSLYAVTDVRTPPQSKWIVSFSHYPWSEAEDGPMSERDIRLHGHIHNNGYTRDGFVPFLRNHINLSCEQTKYRPVNLKLLLDAYLLGTYPETTDEQLAEARERKEANRAAHQTR